MRFNSATRLPTLLTVDQSSFSDFSGVSSMFLVVLPGPCYTSSTPRTAIFRDSTFEGLRCSPADNYYNGGTAIRLQTFGVGTCDPTPSIRF